MRCTCLWPLDLEQSEYWPHGKGLVHLLEALSHGPHGESRVPDAQ